MEKELEVQETQNTPEGETPEVEVEAKSEEPESKEVSIETDEEEGSHDELGDLRHKAEVSSQNFERAKKAEQEVKELRAQLEAYTEPETKEQVSPKVEAELAEVKKKLAETELKEEFPQLKAVWDDFKQYRTEGENAELSDKAVAKLFLVDKGLLEGKRKGLEKQTGGTKTPYAGGMSVEKLADIRKNDHKKYRDMLKKGQIKFRD